MACDICGKTGARVIDLLEVYQTPRIKQICPECETIVNRKLCDIKVLTHGITRDLLKRFMAGIGLGAKTGGAT